MKFLKSMTGLVAALALAGCTITASPMVRHQAAVYGEPYVFYQADVPYVYVGGTVYDYNGYYGQYYGPTYPVPAPPGHAGRIAPPPATVIVGPAYGRPDGRGHGGHEHHGR